MAKINRTDYIASYFLNTKKIYQTKLANNIITLQFFQRKDNVVLAGMSEVLALLEAETDTSKYKIKYLPDGSIINQKEVVLELEGNWTEFGIWEGMIDGILNRYSSIATNARNCVEAAKNKQVIFMGDRADHYLNQEVDGKAVALGGITLTSTIAQQKQQLNNLNQKPFASMPHALIQGFDGDTVAATQAYSELFPNHNIIALVDYHNDVIGESLKVYNALKDKVWGVRIDTSANMVDRMFDNQEPHYGVNPTQIKNLRKALDNAGATNYKIIVSSGITADKITEFEAQNTPVDYYGVGQSILNININFSADATMLNGKKQAKEGRCYTFNEKLVEYN
ncbi:nicotinate phosphoribosyltransferase [Mycoplasma corogypsi]|uniref:nicotinate phosphoribosyltransferase n=1 Tax=Mycoplasma corogypsi TaxID=2106 RepID=UPI003873674F